MPRLPALLAAAALAGPAPAADRPATGTPNPAFDPLDRAVLAHMDNVGATAATVAVSKDGKLLHSRGFGWRDQEKTTPTPPDALFRLASVTKSFTKAVVAEAVRAGHLSPDDKLIDRVGIKPAGGQLGDERLKAVTVRHLLEHKGGWQQPGVFDPVFRPAAVAKKLNLDRPVGPADVVAYALGRELQYDPGTKTAYSNFGYVALGQVLAAAEKQPTYFAALRELVLKPAWVGDVWPGSSRTPHPREVWTPAKPAEAPLEVLDAAGGLVGSAPTVCRFLHRYWLTGDRRRPGEKGVATAFGSLPGTTAMARQRPDGLNVVVLMNNRRDAHIDADLEALKAAVDAAVDKK
jgi:N-acyl-D-amino-acid deacylase